MKLNKQSATERLRKARERRVEATLLSNESTTSERKQIVKQLVKDLEAYSRLKDDITIIVITS
jgi:serine phosphatase RsbU (regulator of sigma subunit)